MDRESNTRDAHEHCMQQLHTVVVHVTRRIPGPRTMASMMHTISTAKKIEFIDEGDGLQDRVSVVVDVAVAAAGLVGTGQRAQPRSSRDDTKAEQMSRIETR